MDCFITDFHVSDLSAVALEDNIMQKGVLAAAGSKILENFIAPFDAEAVTRLRKNHIPIAGRTVMSEFGWDSVSNDRRDYMSGAVGAVANCLVSCALGNDVFGQLRRQAAERGLCYIHPTYGTVSRYGLIPLACSMDQIGVMCKNLDDGFDLLSKIAGKDEKDGAMFPDARYHYEKTNRKLRVGVPACVTGLADPGTQESIRDLAGRFGAVHIELETFGICKQVLYILSAGEFSQNTSRYDGVKCGWRAGAATGLNDLYCKTRTEGLGLEAKLAVILGARALSADHYVSCYEKALKLRRLIGQSLPFDACDVIVLPARISDDPYENLSLYALAPLAGLPSVSFAHKGCGVQLIANAKDENALFTVWEGVRS